MVVFKYINMKIALSFIAYYGSFSSLMMVHGDVGI